MSLETEPLEYGVHVNDAAAEGSPLVVLLHGRGSNEKDLLGLAPLLSDRTIVVAPRAPYPAGAWGYGPGWAWYRYVAEDRVVDDTLDRSLVSLDELMGRLPGELPVAPGPIFLGGFSQGGTLSLAWGLTRRDRVAGVMNLSGFLVSSPLVSITDEAIELPVFWGHGERDPMIPYALAERGRTELRRIGVDLVTADHPGGHQITPEEMAALRQWLADRETGS